jgi:dienelactone hydrolase
VKKIILFFVVLLITAGAAFAGWYARGEQKNTYVLTAQKTPEPRPLEKYQIDSMIQEHIKPGNIIIGTNTKSERGFDTYLIEFWHEPGITDSERKMTSGVVNIPSESGKYPIVLMARGYVDVNEYVPGEGTKNASEFFAQNGLITIAPDFLGYANSDSESSDIFEARFQTYTTFISLIETVFANDPQKLGPKIYDNWDKKNVFIWAHSNGGQITLTSLVIENRVIPTTLWAPVSKPFPYSILYYTDESVDRGKFIRSSLADFEKLYDVENYNFDHHMDRIIAPIQLHQGTADGAVPLEWSNELSREFKANNINYDYYIYPGADHNMRPVWNTVIERDMEFFEKNMLQ